MKLAALIGLILVSGQESPAWHRTLKDGLKASASSGKPVLLVTTWEKGT